jgi:ADP-ribose pyrophosphatase YjhB (NUDIX family)
VTTAQHLYGQAVRESLLERLRVYLPINAADASVALRITEFVQSEPLCAERSTLKGHLTGSAWVVNQSGDKVLLMHHRKLNKWLQPGGHADGELNLLAVALRETREESGLSSLAPLSQAIFDLDIHTIPSRADEPEHLHYDVRFVLRADDSEEFDVSDEALAIKWIPLENVTELSQEESIFRMCNKWQRVRNLVR